MDISEADTGIFETNRRRLFAIAYRMLGSAGEAEDMVQEVFLRWAGAERAAIREPSAWLAKVLTNRCLNVLGSARSRRENVVGVWLPEPVEDTVLGPYENAAQRETVGMGMLLLMERLSPAERAVLILHEAFGYRLVDLAEILDRTPATCRQLLHRARQHLQQGRSRFEADAEQSRKLISEFLRAAFTGDLASLTELLAEDVVSRADGGGRVAAARHPIRGRDRVARYLRGLVNRPEAAAAKATVREINGTPALLFTRNAQPIGVLLLESREGAITDIYLAVDPQKLDFAGR